MAAVFVISHNRHTPCRDIVFHNISKYFRTFSYFFALVSKKYCTFARGFRKTKSNRDVAQLVAHYVRDVGVGRSSRLIPTKKRQAVHLFAVFVFRWFRVFSYLSLLPSDL